MASESSCKYQGTDGTHCTGKDLGNGFCFWHDKTIDKTGMELSERLESYASAGGLTQGLQLKRANLKNVSLIIPGSSKGYDLRNSDLYRANMENAHLFNINLEGASLMKANLNHSNLHCANLNNTNLLGTKLNGAKLDYIKVGQYVQQERIAIQAEKQNDIEKAKDFFEQSEEIYRNLRKSAEGAGIYSLAGNFARKELTMRRKQYDKFSQQRMVSKAVDLFCGYGESPFNVVAFSLILIFICAVLYFFMGVQSPEGMIQFSSQLSVNENMHNFFSSIYFSVVTFTTLGYGDIQPVGYSRLIAAVEAFIGSFALALYVVVFVQKTTR
jgi:hypothetical protein